MIKCKSIKKLLSDYSAGALGAGQMSRVEEHIGSCEACCSELARIEQVTALVETLEEREPPAGLWNGVYNRITQPEPKRSWWQGGWGWPRRLVAGAAVAAAVVAVAFSTLQRPASLPVTANSAMAEYVQGHAILSGQDPFSDRVSLGSLVWAAGETSGNP